MDSESKIKANGKNSRLSGRESVRFAFPCLTLIPFNSRSHRTALPFIVNLHKLYLNLFISNYCLYIVKGDNLW
jgi:hypothetical protein